MNHVWEHAPVSGNDLLMLLALADNANDQGVAWPSLPTLARKTRTDERTARRIIRRLEAEGLVRVQVGGGKGRASRYTLRVPSSEPIRGQIAPLSEETGADRPPLKRKGGHGGPQRGASDAAKGGASAPRTIKEPSEEPCVCVGDAGAPACEAHTHEQAARIVDAWSTTHPAARGQSRNKVLAAVVGALSNGVEPGAINGALARLTADGFVVTDATLAVAVSQVLAEPTSSSSTRVAFVARGVCDIHHEELTDSGLCRGCAADAKAKTDEEES